MRYPTDGSDLQRLAELIHARNANEVAITGIVGRPAQLGHIGEYIASRIFDIELEQDATHPGSDGQFRSGQLAGKSVDVKFYAKREGVLDIKRKHLPDYYLVLAGPKSSATSSKGSTRPWCIKEVFLFEAAPLVARLLAHGVRLGTATSVRNEEWDRARIYPASSGDPPELAKDQMDALRLFDLFE